MNSPRSASKFSRKELVLSAEKTSPSPSQFAMASDINPNHYDLDPTLPTARRHSASDATFKHVSPPKRAPSAALRMFSPVDSDDLEVETVLGDGE